MTDERSSSPSSVAASAQRPSPSSFRPGKLIGPSLAAALASPAALLSYSVPILATGVVLALASTLAIPADSLLITNAAFELVRPPDTLLVFVTIAALVAHLSNSFAMASASYVIVARLSGSDLRASDGWRAATRNWKRVLAAALISGGFLLLFGAIFFGLLLTGNPWIGLAVVLVLVFVIAPFAVSWPLALITAGNPFFSLPSSWRVTRSAALYQSLRGAFVAWLLLSAALDAALVWLAAMLPNATLASATGQFALAVAISVELVVGLSLLCSITLNGLKLLPEPLELLPTPVRSEESRWTWIVAVAAVVAPALLLAGFTTVNPRQITAVNSAQLGATIVPFTTAALSSDSTLTVAQNYDGQFIECSPNECDPVIPYDHLSGVALAPLRDGRALLAQWRAGGADAESQSMTLTATAITSDDLTALRTRENGTPVDGDSTVILNVPTPNVGQLPSIGTAQLAIDTSGEFPVIASVSVVADPEQRAATLDLYRCETVDCSTGTMHSYPVAWEARSVGAFQGLDLAVAKDGTAFISLINDDPNAPELSLLVARDGMDLETHTIAAPVNAGSRTSEESSFGRNGYGAQMVINGDGNPTILYRPQGVPDLTVVACNDPSCETSTETTIPQKDKTAITPALTVDASGRPLIASFDRDNNAVVVLSCDNDACSTWATRTLAIVEQPANDIAITLSAQGLPIVTANYATPQIDEEADRPTVVLQCLQARCGAD